MNSLKTPLFRYGVALLATTIVCLVIPALRLVLRSDFPGEVASPIFLLGIVFSSWQGKGPGLLAAGLSLLALDFFYIPPVYSLNPDWQAMPLACVYLLTPVFVSMVNGRRRRAEETVRRSAVQMLMARTIQQRLLPAALPELPDFDVAAACHPVEATGGDFFDFIPMRHGRIGIVIADVSGHGFAAALLMVEVRAYLRALVRTYDNVSEILTLTNTMLAEDTEDHLFVTLFFACLDPRRRSLVYAGAGHDGYLVHASGRCDRLPSTSLPLGVVKEMVVPCAPALDLVPGDSVILVTDGVIEAMAQHRAMSGINHFIDVICRHRAMCAREMLDILCETARHSTRGKPQGDDMTAVIVKLTAAS